MSGPASHPPVAKGTRGETANRFDDGHLLHRFVEVVRAVRGCARVPGRSRLSANENRRLTADEARCGAPHDSTKLRNERDRETVVAEHAKHTTGAVAFTRSFGGRCLVPAWISGEDGVTRNPGVLGASGGYSLG
jgi:hypothetical protein